VNLLPYLLGKGGKISYSQCGEDLIVDFVLTVMGRSKPSYLDIGAYHPTQLSNTYLFYRKGGRGVLVEPDPDLCRAIRRLRRTDVCLNAGVGVTPAAKANFYIMTTRTLNTFSKEEAERYQSYGNQKIEIVIEIPLLTLEDILRKYFHPCPDFISLDAEGLDLAILKSLDLNRFRPAVFCIETIKYTEDKSELKNLKILEISDIMESQGYMTYADTHINTIYVDAEAFKNRP
jgi:FkbM family methyltransferase